MESEGVVLDTVPTKAPYVHFRIVFTHKTEGTQLWLSADEYLFGDYVSASKAAKHFNDTNNPAWNGDFTVVKIVNGAQTPLTSIDTQEVA